MKKTVNLAFLPCIIALAVIIICSSCMGKDKDARSKTGYSSKTLSTDSAKMTIGEKTSSAAIESEQSIPASSAVSVTSVGLDSKKIGWGPGKVTDNKQPSYAVSCNQKYSSLSARFVGDDKKNIYLTFDEGYENGYTACILDTLKEKNVKATFFVTYDYVNRNPDLVRRMIDEGHTVGNHSWSHPSMPTVTEQRAEEEVMKLHDIVNDKFGYKMKYFRFPMGEFSEKTLATVSKCGYKSVFWSFAYVDWNTANQPDETKSLARITSSVHNGAIYLLHAVSKTNSNILGDVIDNIRNQGYTWIPLDF